MFGRILGTIGTRVLSAAITLIIVLVNARFLGADKVGTIALIILPVTLIQILNNFVGGGSIVYLLPRVPLIQLFLPSYIWAVLSSAAGTLILYLLHIIPEGYALHVMGLSVILSFATINYQVLLGQEKIRANNVITVLQAILLIVVLFLLLFVFRYREVMSYIYGLYASYAFGFILTLILVVPAMKVSAGLTGIRNVLREIFRFGSVMQTGNIFQFLNYRLGFYFIEYFLGTAAVGIYNVGVQLSESIWLVGRSISMVQYTRISNENDPQYAARLTLTLIKISLLLSVISLVAVFALIILFFPLIFSPEFRPIQVVMASLAIGIIVFSVSIVLSPYFSGLGNPKHNTISALIGLVFTALLGFLLVPKLGLAGGGIAASCSYLSSTIYQLVVFIRHTRFRFNDFLLKRTEIEGAYAEVKKFLSSNVASQSPDLSRQ